VSAYYNEHDPHAAQWLRNLISIGAVAPGEVDERDIRDVVPSELAGFTQCHFFAGIGVWSYALRRAGWSDDRPVWTGSCPCQPFSAAGKRGGTDDERHLWPAFHWLIHQCRPETVFGEQVASKDGLAWLDLVLADLEGTGYTGWVGDLCAAGVGAPQIRQRLFFMANADGRRSGDRDLQRSGEQRLVAQDGGALRMAGAEGERLQWRPDDGDEGRRQRASGQGCEAGELGDADEPGLEGRGLPERGCSDECALGQASDLVRPGPTNGFWRDADWIGCTDGKWRPVEPGSFPLASRTAFDLGSGGAFENKSRAKMLKGYGNAIVGELAAEFIMAAMS
jgi:DNA (cytosine-5)-methyltransferase 1